MSKPWHYRVTISKLMISVGDLLVIRQQVGSESVHALNVISHLFILFTTAERVTIMNGSDNPICGGSALQMAGWPLPLVSSEQRTHPSFGPGARSSDWQGKGWGDYDQTVT